MQFAQQYIVNPADDFLQRKIRITNFVAMLYGILSIPFSVFTFYFYPSLMLYPTLFQVAAAMVFLANRWHWYHLSRFINSTSSSKLLHFRLKVKKMFLKKNSKNTCKAANNEMIFFGLVLS